MSVKITCIRKANGDHENPYVAITSMDWINESTNETKTSTRQQMHDFVAKGGEAYVKDALGNKAVLIAKTSPNGTDYVKTKTDSVTSDNLLKLKEC